MKKIKYNIATFDETQVREMSKWNLNQYRSQIANLLDMANEEGLIEILERCRKIDV